MARRGGGLWGALKPPWPNPQAPHPLISQSQSDHRLGKGMHMGSALPGGEGELVSGWIPQVFRARAGPC